MKKKTFAIFLVLALLLAALAGCGQDDNKSSKSDDDDDKKEEQLLEKGYYQVLDEDEDLVGYLNVTSSKITVYDERGREDETLRYDYNEKKGLYTIDDGELFGSEKFTVEKSKKKLKLITEDDEEYTLEAVDEPGPTEKPDNDDSDYVELPLGCYAGYDGVSLEGYLKVERRTITIYYYDGEPDAEISYSYDRDGSCVWEDDRGQTETRWFTYERGDYYMYAPGYDGVDMSFRLEPISESEIPVYTGGSGGTTGHPSDEFYIGDNGYVGLYAWLPEDLYYELDTDNIDDTFIAMAERDDDVKLLFYAILASGDNLQNAVDTARDSYGGAYSSDADLLYQFYLDNFYVGTLEEYLGDVDYSLEEDEVTINGRDWRFCSVSAYEDGEEAWITLLFWMEDDSMAMVLVAGGAEDSYYIPDMYDTVNNMLYSLRLDT